MQQPYAAEAALFGDFGDNLPVEGRHLDVLQASALLENPPLVAHAELVGRVERQHVFVIAGDVAIPRGGAAAWYRDITSNYEDVLSFYTPDEFRVRNEGRILEQRGRLKHVEVSTFDREIIAKVTEKRGLSGTSEEHT